MSAPTLTSAAHIVAAVPYLMGFQPEESHVIVWITDDNQIGLTQRSDLDVAGHHQMIAAGVAHGFTSAVCITFSDKRPEEFTDLHFTVGDNLEAEGIDVIDLLHYSNGRYWTYCIAAHDLPTDPGFEIDEETLLTVQSRFVLSGMGVVESRQELIDAVTPSDANARKYGAAKRYWTERREDIGVVGARYDALAYAEMLTFEAEPSEQDYLRVSASLEEINLRDALVYYMAQMDNDTLRDTYNVIADVCRATPRSKAAPILTLAGICGYLAGNGAVANICFDLAMDIEEYNMAKMGSVAVNAGLPPSEFRTMLCSLDIDEIMGKDDYVVA